MKNNVTRAFRIPKDLDLKVEENARELGYLNPSEYLRTIVRQEMEKREVQ